MTYDVALHLFWGDTTSPGHGHTDSARYTVEADSRDEAIVLATQLAVRGYTTDDDMRITSAAPWVHHIPVGA